MEIKDQNGKVIAKITGADQNISGCDEGVWVELQADDGTRPTLCMVKDQPGGPHGGNWYLGVYRDSHAAKIVACDLAIMFCKEHGPELQVTKGDQVKSYNLFDLLSKL